MSRVAKAITCTNSDIKSLNNVINNEFASESVKLRCRAILMASKGLQNKDIAAELNIRKNTVGDWRKVWETGGLDALVGIQRTGRPKSEGRKKLENAIEGNDNNLVVTSCAEENGISTSTVYRVLASSESGQTGVPVLLNTESKTVDIVGLFISDGQAAILLESSGSTSIGRTSYGRMFTRDERAKQILQRISDENGEIQLYDALNALALQSHELSCKARGISLQSFLERIVPKTVSMECNEFHLIYYGNVANAKISLGASSGNIHLFKCSDDITWLKETAFWLCLMGLDDDSAAKVIDTIEKYKKQRRKGMEQFLWHKCKDDLNDIFDNGSEQDTYFTDPSIENVVTVTATIRNRDGSETCSSVTELNAIPSAENIDYATPLTFGNSIGNLDTGLGKVFRKAQVTLMEEYLEHTVKKTKS